MTSNWLTNKPSYVESSKYINFFFTKSNLWFYSYLWFPNYRFIDFASPCGKSKTNLSTKNRRGTSARNVDNSRLKEKKMVSRLINETIYNLPLDSVGTL